MRCDGAISLETWKKTITRITETTANARAKQGGETIESLAVIRMSGLEKWESRVQRREKRRSSLNEGIARIGRRLSGPMENSSNQRRERRRSVCSTGIVNRRGNKTTVCMPTQLRKRPRKKQTEIETSKSRNELGGTPEWHCIEEKKRERKKKATRECKKGRVNRGVENGPSRGQNLRKTGGKREKMFADAKGSSPRARQTKKDGGGPDPRELLKKTQNRGENGKPRKRAIKQKNGRDMQLRIEKEGKKARPRATRLNGQLQRERKTKKLDPPKATKVGATVFQKKKRKAGQNRPQNHKDVVYSQNERGAEGEKSNRHKKPKTSKAAGPVTARRPAIAS